MKFIIIILNWNGREDTIACIASILTAGAALSDLLVVDNCSDDGSVEALVRRFPGLDVLRTDENLGYTGGNNAGIRHALASGADIVLLLNNDTEVAPGFISPLLEAFHNDPTVGVAGSMIYFHAHPHLVWFGEPRLDPRSGRTWDGACGREASGDNQVVEIPFASGCAMALSRRMLENIGLFDDRFFCYAEELDLCLRARAAGFRVVLVPESKVYHKVSASTGGSRSGSTMYYRVRNHLLCMNKNLPLSSRFGEWRRNLSIIAVHVAAVSRLGMERVGGLRALSRGVRDYFCGRFGRVAGLW